MGAWAVEPSATTLEKCHCCSVQLCYVHSRIEFRWTKFTSPSLSSTLGTRETQSSTGKCCRSLPPKRDRNWKTLHLSPVAAALVRALRFHFSLCSGSRLGWVFPLLIGRCSALCVCSTWSILIIHGTE